jgi:hypothetical protein
MTRFRLTIEYDGRPFMGWQRQPHGPSVQAAIEDAGKAITGESIILHAAGRTDAGVHAEAMSAHLDVTKTVTALHNVSTTSKLYIGGTPAQLGASFTGLIDEMTLYDRALGTSEIQAIFDAGCNGKAKPLPIAALNVPSVLCQGMPFIADGSASQFATSYSWCWTPVADDCQTPLPPYGACFAPCACPTWDFNVTPGNLPPGKYRIDLYVSNDAGSDHVSQCVELKGPPPVAAFTLPDQVCVGQPIVADASASQNATSYSWCWGATAPPGTSRRRRETGGPAST